jgi:hypothetical protein
VRARATPTSLAENIAIARPWDDANLEFVVHHHQARIGGTRSPNVRPIQSAIPADNRSAALGHIDRYV